MPSNVPSNDQVRNKVTAALDEVGLRYDVEDKTIVIVFRTSGDEKSELTVAINVRNRETFLGEVPFVTISAPMVVGVPADENGNFAKTASFVNTFNLGAILLRAVFRIEELDGTDYLSIHMETELLATDLDSREVLVALSELEGAANALDDDLADALGGMTFATLARELASRVKSAPTDV